MTTSTTETAAPTSKARPDLRSVRVVEAGLRQDLRGVKVVWQRELLRFGQDRIRIARLPRRSRSCSCSCSAPGSRR